MIKSMVVGIVLMGVGATLSDWGWDFITLEQFQGSQMSPEFFGDFIDG